MFYYQLLPPAKDVLDNNNNFKHYYILTSILHSVDELCNISVMGVRHQQVMQCRNGS